MKGEEGTRRAEEEDTEESLKVSFELLKKTRDENSLLA